jgi:hypothetical protein
MNQVMESARRWLAAGYSILPIATDGRKRPAGQVLPRDQDGHPSWLPYQSRIADEDELARWYGSAAPYGIGIICGDISGSLIVLDCESEQVWLDIEREARAGGGRLQELVDGATLVATPSGGRHLFIHLDCQVPGGTVLARDQNRQVLVETRGAGHYVVAPGSPASVHETNQPYVLIRSGTSIGNEFEDVGQLWTAAELESILSIARSFNRYVPPEMIRTSSSPGSPGPEADSPGSVWNRTGDWAEILEPHGWRPVGTRGDTVLWCRPGKSSGISATTGHCRTPGSGDLLFVFSSNAAPFEPDTAYSKFAALALLSHGGDFSAAAKDLRERGIGGTESADFQFQISVPPPDVVQPDGSVRARRYLLSSELSAIDPDVQWLVHGLIRRGAGTMLSAHPKAGKTTFMAHMLKALGAGEPFLGLATKASKVLIISEEDQSTLAERRDDIGLGNHLGWYVRPFPVRPTMVLWQAFLKEVMSDGQHFGADLVILDTLAKHLPCKDENHATEVETALQPLWALTQSNMGLMCIHHTKKQIMDDGTGARGSLAFNGFFEVLLELSRTDKSNLADNRRTLRGMSRLKHCPDELIIELVDGVYRRAGSDREYDRARLESKVMEYLNRSGQSRIGDICLAADAARPQVQTVLDQLAAAGIVSVTGERTDRRDHRAYGIANNGNGERFQ